MTDQNMTRSLLDRAIEYMAPQWGLRRVKARALSEVYFRHYEAAATGRRTQMWRRPVGDANAVIGPAIGNVRAVARDLSRNNSHAKKGIRAIANHTVGWGITVKAKPASEKTAAVWKDWAETSACDADGRNDFYGLQKLIVRAVAESGEVLVRRRIRRPDDRLPIPMQLQVLEGDYIDTARTHDVLGAGGQRVGRVINGVEFDPIGRRTAYWLFQEHPGATLFGGGYNSVRVPASGVLHVYLQERPGQIRGMSWLATVILGMKDFDEYDDAQLLKQKVAAYLSIIAKDPAGDASRFGRPEDQDAEQPYADRLKPGGISYLPPGMDVTVVQPPSVREFGEYSKVKLRQTAAGMGTTYEDLTGDYSDYNFSSARMSRLAHWDDVHDWRWQMLIPQFCDPAWRWAMETAAIMGKVDAVPTAEWTPPPMPMIEPDKEGLAIQRNVRSGIQTLSDALRERGYDPQAVLEEMATDNKLLDKLGLILDSDPRRTTQQGQAQAAGPGSMPEERGERRIEALLTLLGIERNGDRPTEEGRVS